MPDTPRPNGNVTLREVYALVEDVRKEVGKVADAVGGHDTRLALLECVCQQRPQNCVMMRTVAATEASRAAMDEHVGEYQHLRPDELQRLHPPADKDAEEEQGDMRRAWRVGRWVLAAAVLFWLQFLSAALYHAYISP